MSAGDFAKLILGAVALAVIGYLVATGPARHRAWADECRADGGRPVWRGRYFAGCAEERQ